MRVWCKPAMAAIGGRCARIEVRAVGERKMSEAGDARGRGWLFDEGV